MRLDQLLGKAGFGGRNAVKKLIRSRQVSVDGRLVTTEGAIVDSGLQEIVVSGQVLREFGSAYFLLNKPAGVVSAVTDKEHQTVIDLLHPKDRYEGLYPVGRLDRDTEGLLLITNNGPLGFRLLHPKYHVNKTYYVEINGMLGQEAVQLFQTGVIFLDGTQCQPVQLKICQATPQKSTATVTLREGKFHQIKKMFLSYGVKVIYLKRICFGPFLLEEDLLPGQYRTLTLEEVQDLKMYLD